MSRVIFYDRKVNFLRVSNIGNTCEPEKCQGTGGDFSAEVVRLYAQLQEAEKYYPTLTGYQVIESF